LFRFATLFWWFRVPWVYPQITQITQKRVWLVAVLALIQEFGSAVPLWLPVVLAVIGKTIRAVCACLPPGREPDCTGRPCLPQGLPACHKSSRTAATPARSVFGRPANCRYESEIDRRRTAVGPPLRLQRPMRLRQFQPFHLLR
jgi:hypothetical protein